jgi:hypothetical protein
MSRILDANEKFVGSEPKVAKEITNSELGTMLSWYSQNKSKKDATKYAVDYFKKKIKLSAESVLKNKNSTFGFVCRIVTNGSILTEKDKEWFDTEVETIKKELEEKKEDTVVVIKTGPNIQDRIREKANACIGELEGQIDELIDTSFKANVSPYSVMHTLEVKGVHVKQILDWVKLKRTEFDYVLNTDEEDLKEGYSNFKKTELKKIVAYCDQVIIDAGKFAEMATQSRKPRKKKQKSPEQLVAKAKYCQEYKELGLTSVDIKSIIGVSQLWVYNTKLRKLGMYQASDAGGLSVKGSSIVNFSEEKSIQKKLRKPEVTLPEVLSGGKVYLRNALSNIRAVESALSGRLNDDTILLRVVK